MNKGVWHYLYRAIDKEGQTLDWMLSKAHNKKAAKKFFKKSLYNTHIAKNSAVNVDKASAFVPAHNELQKSGELNPDTTLRRVK